MNRRQAALKLAVLVALSGLLPIAVIGAISLEVMRRNGKAAAQGALRAVAEQAAARIAGYAAAQLETLRGMTLSARQKRLRVVFSEGTSELSESG